MYLPFGQLTLPGPFLKAQGPGVSSYFSSGLVTKMGEGEATLHAPPETAFIVEFFVDMNV